MSQQAQAEGPTGLLYRLRTREGYGPAPSFKRTSFWYPEGPGTGGYYGGFGGAGGVAYHLGETSAEPQLSIDKLCDLMTVAFKAGFAEGQESVRNMIRGALGV